MSNIDMSLAKDIRKIRRLRRFIISAGDIMQMFMQDLKLEIVKGIPRDAKCVGFAHDYERNGIVIFVEHESFSPVQEGHMVPLADPVDVRQLL